MRRFSVVDVDPAGRLVLLRDEHTRHHLAAAIGAPPPAGTELVGMLQPNAAALLKSVEGGDTLPMVFVIDDVHPQAAAALLRPLG